MNKKLIFLGGLVLFLLVGVGVWLGYALSRTGNEALSEYSAVYLVSGDLYFGKMKWFPHPHLEDVWYVDRGTQNTQAGIAPFRTVFWGPSDELYISPKQVLWRTRLKADSQVVRALENNLSGSDSGSVPQGNPGSEFQGPSNQPPAPIGNPQ